MLFDVLWLDGHSLMELPYHDRRARLQELDLTGASWQTPPHEVGDGAATLEVSKRFGLEGVVAKRLDCVYEPGRRSRQWIKLKYTMRQEFVVGGWLPGEGGRSGTVGSLLVGYYEGEATGGTFATRRGRQRPARRRSRVPRSHPCRARAPDEPVRDRPPPKGARFVEPELVVEVRFTEWTNSGGLRAPVFLGYRTDKPAAEVERSGRADPPAPRARSGTRVTAIPARAAARANTIASCTAQPPVSLLKYT